MKISIEKSKLMQAINAVTKVVKKNPVFPILEGVLIETLYNGIKLTGTDRETTIQYSTDCTVEKPGKVIVDANLFSEIVKKMEGDIRITVESNFATTIESDNSKMKIMGLDTTGFPAMPEISSDAKTFEIDQQAFKDMVARISFAVGFDANKPMMAGIYINVINNHLDMVALDGFHMAVRRHPVDSIDTSILLDGKTLETVTKAFEYDKIAISISKNQVQFKNDSLKIAMRTLDFTYINYRQIISNEYTNEFRINPKVLFNSISKAILLISETDKKMCPLFLTIKGDNLNISITTSLGELSENIPVEISGEKLKIAFNPVYLTNCLKQIKEEEILVRFIGENKPVMILPVEGDSFLYFALPVRIAK